MINKLQAIGGKLWEKEDKRRVYFNGDALMKLYGLEYDGWKYTLDGEKVSNNTGRILSYSLRTGKFWYDLNTGEFASTGMNEKMTQELIERITEAMEAVEANER